MATEDVTIDETYEFSAPRFFDFIRGESQEDIVKAERWFDNGLSYAPSPYMPKIKTGRSVIMESLCDFSEADQLQKVPDSTAINSHLEMKLESEPMPTEIRKEEETTSIKTKEENITSLDSLEEATSIKAKEENKSSLVSLAPNDKPTCQVKNEDGVEENKSVLAGRGSTNLRTKSAIDKESPPIQMCTPKPLMTFQKGKDASAVQVCTPVPLMTSQKGGKLLTDSKKQQQTAKKVASSVRNPSALKPRNQSQLSQAKNNKSASGRRDPNVKNIVATPNLPNQENQAIKRQKLEGGDSRQILSVKPQNLHHKSNPAKINGSSSLHLSTAKTRKEDRKVYVRDPPAPFVSMAEMMNKFQSNTRGINSSHDDVGSAVQRKAKLTLTHPKEPDLETAQRVRSVRVKSSAELEEEMMAKIPKFKARPVNKKILEAPTLPALPRSTPQLPEFQEFHLETRTRANQNAEASSTAASIESNPQNHQWKPHHLTEPKTPLLQTSLRARPVRVKSSVELEQEELEKVPKFKARPLNKKIFESKGDLGVFCNLKKHITIPQEFHFATNERFPPSNASICDLFDKLSLNSEPRHENQLPRITLPNPFNLHTEERGAEKERKFVMEIMQKQIEEERARVPKATPYPYTTDYPVIADHGMMILMTLQIPPKPEPKQITKPEPFQLESVARHEEEMRRETEERQRMEKEEAEMRKFKAQPVIKEDPIPVPEKVRKPLTQVQEFNLHVDNRAVDRAEFDQKIKEKEMMYKRYREESESARMMEEEKALKQMRRTMVPHARPVPNFEHPFLPQKSCKETTKAKSPNLRVLRRERRKNVSSAVKAATSSPASCMR